MGRGGGTGGGRRDRRDRSGSEWDMMGLGRARTEIAMSGIIDQRLWERLGRYTRYSTIQWRREVPPNNTGQHSQLLAVCDQRSWCWCQQFVLCGADSAGIWHCKETWTGWVVLWDCGLWHCECSTTYHPRGCGCVSCTHGREDSSKGQTTLSELSVPRQVGRCMRDGGSFSLWCLLVCWLLVVGCWLLVVGCWLLVVGCRLPYTSIVSPRSVGFAGTLSRSHFRLLSLVVPSHSFPSPRLVRPTPVPEPSTAITARRGPCA